MKYKISMIFLGILTASMVNVSTADIVNQDLINSLKQSQKDHSLKFSGTEEAAGKTLMCLAAGGVAPGFACSSLLKSYFKMKPHKRPGFLMKSPVVKTNKAQEQANRVGYKAELTPFLKQNGITDDDLGQKIIDKNTERVNSFVNNMDFKYNWKNKNSGKNAAKAPKGVDYYDGFSCDVDPETGLNQKIEYEVGRIFDPEADKEIQTYFARTLTELPHNCKNTAAHFPTVVMPKYNTTRCDKRWFMERDYDRGYYLRRATAMEQSKDRNVQPKETILGYVGIRHCESSDDEKGYSNCYTIPYAKIKIEKVCWDLKKEWQEAMDAKMKKAQEDTIKNYMSKYATKKHVAQAINTELYNLTTPNKFKLPIPSLD